MLIELVEIKKTQDEKYKLSKIFLNPEHIIYLSEDTGMRSLCMEGRLSLPILQGASFTKIKLNQTKNIGEITVVGDPSSVESKIWKNKKRQILRG